jgi:hypothetical protein
LQNPATTNTLPPEPCVPCGGRGRKLVLPRRRLLIVPADAAAVAVPARMPEECAYHAEIGTEAA